MYARAGSMKSVTHWRRAMRYHVLDAARERATAAPLATRVDVFDGASCAVDGGDASRGVNERFASGFKFSARGSYGVAYDAHARAFIVYDGAMGDGDARRPSPALRAVRGGEGCYDWAWSSGGGREGVFAATRRDAPTIAFDATTGDVIASYRSYDQYDEIAPACGIDFIEAGGKIVCGLDGRLDVFDVSRPGRDVSATMSTKKTQRGLISCVAGCPTEPTLFACGSYGGLRAKDCAVYDGRSGAYGLSWASGGSGVTCAKWSPDGNFLYIGARRDSKITCVDVRHTGHAVYAIERDTTDTNQRVLFDIEPCGAHLISGDAHGYLRVYDLRDGAQVRADKISDSCVNSFAFHPYAAVDDAAVTFGGRLVRGATTSGERTFSVGLDSDSESGDGAASASAVESSSSSSGAIAAADDESSSASDSDDDVVNVEWIPQSRVQFWNWPTRAVEY